MFESDASRFVNPPEYRPQRLGIIIANDWEPQHGSVVYCGISYLILRLIFSIVLFFGIIVLFSWYLPVTFQDITEFMIEITSPAGL